MKKLILSMMLLALPILASAYDVQIDGIYYNLIPKAGLAEVTYLGINQNGFPYSDYSSSITIPEKFTYEGVEYTVTSIGGRAFYGCSRLTSITIPNSVTSIEDSAFSGCNGLTSVHISDLEAWCKIEFGSYGSNPLCIAHHLYLNGEEIRKLAIPNSVTSIGNYAFSGCSGLTSITIPNSVTRIGNEAFFDCSNLTTITIPNSVTRIGNEAFYACSNLTSVTIPNSVTSIEDYVFYGCSGLTSITIPNSVISIGEYAFDKCYSLTSVTIPNSVTSIGNYAFSRCSSLTSITIPNSVTSISQGAFSSCSGMISLTIPNSVTYIGNYAFSSCSGMISLTIPNSVTSIGNSAFRGCGGLTSVTIGSGVRYIYERAFAECSKLDEVYCLAEQVPSTNTYVFEKSYPEFTTLYVPASSLNAYKTTEPWSDFGTIMAIDGSGTEPEEKKCVTPTISYADKRLTFSCETEGVEYVYEIKDADIKKGYDAAVDLTATYEISVYATKAGYEDSDAATATLVWTNAIFTEATEPSTSAKAVTESIPVLISAQGGTVTVKCEQEGQPVAVYTADGKALGSATVKDGQATVATNLQRGEVVIVKVGGRSVKVKM